MRRRFGPSLRALFAHKVRAVLALSSVSVGVAAVVLTGAISAGAQREILQRMESMGTNLLVVRPAPVKRLVARKTIAGSATTLAIDDYEAIAALDLVATAAPGAEGTGTIKRGTLATRTTIRGTTPSFPSVRRFRLRAGRFFDDADDRAARRVAVLAARVADALFPEDAAAAIGEDIRVRGVPFEVVGVLEGKGVTADGSDEDNQVLIPVQTALRRMFNVTWLNAVFVSVTQPERMDEAMEDIGRLLRERHRSPGDFQIQNTMRTLSVQMDMASFLGQLTTGLAAIALVVGGTGILALMLLSVKERTGEIGLRIAVGATPSDILVQFLIEALLLSAGGWLIGLAIGAAGAFGVALGTEWQVALPTKPLLLSLAMVLVIGLGFGAVPARKASRLPPIEALLTQ